MVSCARQERIRKKEERPLKFIPFPRNCHHGVDGYRIAIDYYNDAVQSSEDVAIDCGDVRFFQPMGLTLLASLTCALTRDTGRKVYFSKPTEAGVLRYLTDQDFFKEFSVEGSTRIEAVRRSSSLGLKRLEHNDLSYIDQIPRWLELNSHMPPEAIKDVILTTVPEIIANVFDHSRSPIGCYICAQAYPNLRQLKLSTIDLGVGLLKTLQPKFPDLRHDSDAIALAVQPGITSKSRPNNAGIGLDVLRGFLMTSRGTLEIVSRDGCWKQEADGSTTKSVLPFEFPGTCINLTFDDQAIMDRFTPGDRYE